MKGKPRKRIVLFAAALASGIAFCAPASEWIDAITSGVEADIATARQMAPFEGVDALQGVMDLIAHGDYMASRTAILIAQEITAEATAPGRDADRRRAMGIVEQYLAPGRTPQEKIAALRIFARTAPDGWSADPAAALLRDDHEGVRARAHEALEEMGTEQARAALRALLRDGDDAQRLAAAASLGQLADAQAEPMLRRLMSGGADEVRPQAARALAEILAPGAIGDLLDYWGEADGVERRLAADAVLRLAQRAEDHGAHGDALRAYRSMLSSGEANEVVAASAGLGRVGESPDTAPLGRNLRSDSRAVRHAAIAALSTIDAPEAARMLVDAYAGAPPADKPLVLRALGVRGDDAGTDLLEAEAADGTGEMRLQAIRALGGIPSQRAVEALRAPSLSDDARVAAAARAALLRIGSQYMDAGRVEESAVVYQLVAESPGASIDERRRALAGVSRAPGLDAYDVAMALAEIPELGPEAAALLVELAVLAEAEGDEERSQTAFQKAFSIDGSVDLRQRYVALLAQRGIERDTDGLLGVVRRWRVIGPFNVESSVQEEWDREFLDPADPDPSTPVEHKGEMLEWRLVDGAGPFAMVDLVSVVGPDTQTFAYAYAEVVAPERQIVQIRMGTDDGVTLWLNGAKIHDNMIDRGVVIDQDIVPARLDEGVNTILLRISQGVAGWGYALRITDRQGNGLDLEEVTE